MPSGLIRIPGRAPTRSEQLLLAPLIEKMFPGYDETVVIHHITEDTAHRLQLEIERRISWVTAGLAANAALEWLDKETGIVSDLGSVVDDIFNIF